MPIDSARGRGGGLRLQRHWSVGRVNLGYREAIDALLSFAVAEKLGSSLFLERIRTTRNKLAATFSPSHRDKIRSLRRRILIGAPATARVLASYDANQAVRGGAVTEAFFELKRLQISYVDGQDKRTVREVEPQFLYLSWSVWYLLAWDELREGVRTFRIDRILESEITPHGFRLRDEGPFLQAIEDAGNRL